MTPTACSARAPAPRTVATRKEANELRKTLKPLLEKKRRARINASLDRLKALILPLSGKDNGRNSKLEKADILEMTVRFLTDIQTTPSNDGSVSFKEGYTTCLQRASARLPQTSLDVQTRRRIREFIHSSLAPETPACQTCCAHSSRIMAQIQQALLTVKPNSSRVENTAILSQNQPLTTDAKVWRPW